MHKITISWCSACMCWSIVCPECGEGSTCNGVENCDTCKKINELDKMIPYGSDIYNKIDEIVQGDDYERF